MTEQVSSLEPEVSEDKAAGTPPPNRRWITILIVLLLAAGVLVLALLRPWVPSPDSIIREARDRTTIISSCRVSCVQTETLGGETVITAAEGEYAVPFRSALRVTRGDDVYDFISIGDDTWVKGAGDAASLLPRGLLSDLFVRGPHSVVNAVGYLRNIERHIDQPLDGVPCYHYSGTFIDPDGAEAGLLDETISPSDHDYLFALHDRSVTTMQADVWIEKKSSFVRQVRVIVRNQGDKETVLSATLKLYDFNEDIAVEPPLDDDENLLSGWSVLESRS